MKGCHDTYAGPYTANNKCEHSTFDTIIIIVKVIGTFNLSVL